MTSSIRIVPNDDSNPHDLPAAEYAAISQTGDADDLLFEDKSKYPRITRLPSLNAITGAFAPGEIIIVMAREGSGKSLFCQNLADDLLGQKIVTLYIGTEQQPKVLRIKHACIRAGVTPKWMLKPEPHEMATTAWRQAREAVREQLSWLKQPEQANRLIFANEPYVDRSVLEKWVDGGINCYEIGAVIVDHIDQVSHGPGTNTAHEVTATVQLLHEMAQAYSIPIFVASQVKRAIDPFKRYSPPEASDAAGTSGKERIASLIMSLWRPLRTDLPPDELRELLKQAKQGGGAENKIYQKDTMGIRVVKDRLGDAPGQQCMAHVGRGGKLSDDEGATHGIRSSRSL